MKVEQIEPCPNPECCGAETTGVTQYEGPKCFSVRCYRCGYAGPEVYGDEPAAIALHNRIARAVREAGEPRAENTRLRAALAMSDKPCAYCTLPADEIFKCQSGFPGCSRADDAMGCPHFGASLEVQEQRERAEKTEAERDALRALIERHNREWPEAQIDMPARPTDGGAE